MTVRAWGRDERRMHGWTREGDGISTVTVDAVTWCALINAARVARRTFKRTVSSAKRKVRERVLKFGIVPELLAMAIATVRKRSMVDVILLVTEDTIVTHA